MTGPNSFCEQEERIVRQEEGFGDEYPDRTDTLRRRTRSARVTIPQEAAAGFMDALRKKTKLVIAVGKIPVLRTISLELFDSVEIEFNSDPEISGMTTVAFIVKARGDDREIADRRQEWHRRTHGVLDGASEFVQLLIDVE